MAPKDAKKYFGENGEGLHLMFNFFSNQHLFYALASGDVKPLRRALELTKDKHPAAQWANFLRNHDELDLGRLTEKQRQRVFDAFGPEKNMQLYDRGIRRRLAPMLGDRAHIELAYSLMFSLPGTPVMRYGDEIGMGDDLSLKERAAVRTPMQWSDEDNAGFSDAKAKDLIHPVISEGPYRYELLNVETQARQTDSILTWTKRMVQLRKKCPEIGEGEWRILDVGEPSTLAMTFENGGERILVVHNFAMKPREVALDTGWEKDCSLVDLIDPLEVAPEKNGTHLLRLGAFGYRWFRCRSRG